ncbi:MAG TPA: double-strand break repair helicase AddA [Xanthobacteraceae bacterium]|nr:double-strand break repair helicase AddA [Xanthobacteraceae bacterium]
MSVRTIPEPVRRLQAQASDPQVSAFVSANAGAGKTHVLALRVIRLLLAGTDPMKILCITFTKAAAANMAARVFDTLAQWIALDDDALDREMRAIGETAIGPHQRARARRLFASALDTPGGLKVQTIHAFCTRLLHQFPFEANVAARFAVLDERAEDELLTRSVLAVLLDATRSPGTPLAGALAAAIAAAADRTFRELVRELMARRDEVTTWIARAGGVAKAIDELSRTLGIDPKLDLAALDHELLDGGEMPSAQWTAIAALCEEGSKTDNERGAQLRAAFAAGGATRVAEYLSVFLTDTMSARKNVITVGLGRKRPELAERLAREQGRVCALLEKRNAILCRDRTAALITIGAAVIARYRAEKEARGLLDYDDLIVKTLTLLTTVNPGWVHYKLDRGIDHVLIDEAQDTSEAQWEIITRLVAEFTSGTGARDVVRTIFAVGDEKQSIFSFQGAVPRKFDDMRWRFEQAHVAIGASWRFVRFGHSFRSGPNVLGAVDEVFSRPEIFPSVTSDTEGFDPHLSLPDAAPGLVEIWPIIRPPERREMEGWDAPFDALSQTSPQVRLANRIAETIAQGIRGGEPLGRERRPMRAGDVLVLVRQRGALFEAIIRALKQRHIAVAGADRLVLTEHIAVVDLMALADALLLPHDDLALAVTLKSPLFGIDEEQLFDLAHGRAGSLRAALAAKHAEAPAFAAAQALLDRCAAQARGATPFGFYAWLLGAAGGRAKFLRRLGPEAADALDEFLELALDYERREPPSLQGFMAWLRAAQTEIKRDMEISRDEVRVMTVHGAKGLEAPLVILADTTSAPAGPRPPRLLGLPAPNAAPGTPDRIVWAGKKATDAPPVASARQTARAEAEHEYRRLLYVAMTRAADRLIVAGCEGERARPAGCWYDLVLDGLRGREGFHTVGEGDAQVWRYRKVPDTTPPRLVDASAQGEFALQAPFPVWLRRAAAAEPERIAAITPSESEGRSPAERRGAGGEARRLAIARGTLIHRLMQSLPDIAPGRRAEAARRYVARAAADFTPEEREAFVATTLQLLDDPRFAALFAPGSRAEVPIIGRLTRAGRAPLPVSGQIDRLAVTDSAVLIADYKTNRPAPRTLEEAIGAYPAYVRQLALYRAMVGRLYPGRVVRAALIWTDVPDLMEFSADVLEAEMARLTSA